MHSRGRVDGPVVLGIVRNLPGLGLVLGAQIVRKTTDRFLDAASRRAYAETPRFLRLGLPPVHAGTTDSGQPV